MITLFPLWKGGTLSSEAYCLWSRAPSLDFNKAFSSSNLCLRFVTKGDRWYGLQALTLRWVLLLWAWPEPFLEWSVASLLAHIINAWLLHAIEVLLLCEHKNWDCCWGREQRDLETFLEHSLRCSVTAQTGHTHSWDLSGHLLEPWSLFLIRALTESWVFGFWPPFGHQESQTTWAQAHVVCWLSTKPAVWAPSPLETCRNRTHLSAKTEASLFRSPFYCSGIAKSYS